MAVQWFTIVKVPLLKLAIGDQTLRFAPLPEGDPWEQRVFPYRCLKVVQQARGVLEATYYAYARLFDYFSGAELPIDARITYAEYALPGWRERARHTLVLFKVLLEDPQWRREKVVKARGLLEVHSARGEVQRDPERSLFYQEWVVLSGKKFTRVLGIFSTANDPFVASGEEVVE
jgi:hypothetical protein